MCYMIMCVRFILSDQSRCDRITTMSLSVKDEDVRETCLRLCSDRQNLFFGVAIGGKISTFVFSKLVNFEQKLEILTSDKCLFHQNESSFFFLFNILYHGWLISDTYARSEMHSCNNSTSFASGQLNHITDDELQLPYRANHFSNEGLCCQFVRFITIAMMDFLTNVTVFVVLAACDSCTVLILETVCKQVISGQGSVHIKTDRGHLQTQM